MSFFYIYCWVCVWDVLTGASRGPLIFCLLLSMFLSMRAKDEQSSLVFSGVFSIVWIGEAVVTLQIKLLGGNMYVLHPDWCMKGNC